MRILLLVMLQLLPSFISCQRQQEGDTDFQCKRGDDGVLRCEFSVPDGTKALELSECFGDDCVSAQVTIISELRNASDETKQELLNHLVTAAAAHTARKAALHAKNNVPPAVPAGVPDNEKKREALQAQAGAVAAASAAAAHTQANIIPLSEDGVAGTEYAMTVAGQTFEVPWSQYGTLVADALDQRHGRTNWDYGDWLITLAAAVRGTDRAEMDPQIVDRVVDILESAVQTFSALEQGGLGDATVSIGNAYMTMAETYIYDSYNPRYPQALLYFTLSKNLFKEALDDDTKIPVNMIRTDVEINWADTLVRIAVLSIEEQMGAADAMMDPMDLDNLAGGGMPQMSETTTHAETLLVDAITVFRRQVALPFSDTSKAVQRGTRLANALQNLASITMLATNQMDKSNALLEEAITHYKRALGFGFNGADLERDNAISGAAESLYSLADGYLQEGKYDLSKARYRDTMEWYEKYNIAQPSLQDVHFANAEESLIATEQALEDYNSMLYGGGEIPIPNDRSRPGESIYQADEVYEADLHATLGALRMANNEIHVAIHHLASAIERYARDPVEAGRALADARMNLAMAYFKQGEYALSIEAHTDALDVYQELVREGKNPLMDGLEDLLAQHGVDPEMLQPQADGGGVAAEGGANNNAQGSGGDRLIDLSAYKASILNATANEEL